MPQVNPWLREYIKADAEAGKFELYMELAAADGKFKGYAKPILQDVDMYRSERAEQSPLGACGKGSSTSPPKCWRTRRPTRWRRAFRSPAPSRIRETSLFATIASVMRNAFISAFARSLEGSITLRDVKKNLNELDPRRGAADKRTATRTRRQGRRRSWRKSRSPARPERPDPLSA